MARNLQLDAVRAVMSPGVEYTASELAAVTGLPVNVVAGCLTKMYNNGTAKKIAQKSWRHPTRWYLASAAPAKRPEFIETVCTEVER